MNIITQDSIAANSMLWTRNADGVMQGTVTVASQSLDGLSRIAASHNAIHVVIRNVTEVFSTALFEYEILRLDALSLDSLLRRILKELELISVGPRSLVIGKTIPTDSIGGRIFDSYRYAMKDVPLVLHFAQMDSIVSRCSAPHLRTANVAHFRRLDCGLLRAAAMMSEAVTGCIPNLAIVFGFRCFNCQAYWDGAGWREPLSLSHHLRELESHDAIADLCAWHGFKAESFWHLAQQPMWLGPPVVRQAFDRHMDRIHAPSLSQIANQMPSIIKAVQSDLRNEVPGWRYMSKSMVVLLCIVRNCEFSLRQCCSEYLMRLVGGGLLHLNVDKVTGLYHIASPFPMLTDRIAHVLGVSFPFLHSLFLHAKFYSVDNTHAMWSSYILLELFQLSSNRLWMWLRERHGLESMLANVPEIVSLEKLDTWSLNGSPSLQVNLQVNRVYIFTPSRTARELAFVARSGCAPCSVLLRLVYAGGTENIENCGYSVTATPARPDDAVDSTDTESSGTERVSKWKCSSMSGLFTFDKIIDVTEADLLLPISEPREAPNNESAVEDPTYSCDGNAVFDRLFKGLRIKTPWCDVSSSRSRVYNHYMCESLRIKYASGRMALRQHKATGLSYMANAEVIERQLHVSRYELSFYRAYSVSAGSRLEIPETKSVKSIRTLIKLLIAWGTDVAEVIETRKLLKRNRIFWLDRATQPDRLIESSQLALGTKLAIKAVLQSVRPPAKTSFSL